MLRSLRTSSISPLRYSAPAVPLSARLAARAHPSSHLPSHSQRREVVNQQLQRRLTLQQRRGMATAPSREQELEQLPKSELVRLLLAAEQQPPAAHPQQQQQQGTKRPSDDAGSQGVKRKKGKPAKKKPFDISQHRQRHVALKIAYYGQTYHGFASQDNSDNTIEAHLFRALQRTCLIKDRESANYSRCGRTDKGVSALGQVVGLYLRSKHTDPTNPALVSSEAVDAAAAPKKTALPKVVATDSGPGGGDDSDGGDAPGYSMAEAARNEVVHDPSEWDAPEPESELNYVKMLNGVLPPEIRVLGWAHVPPSSLFSARFSCQQRVYHYYFPRGALDISAMAEAASAFVGEHDFRNFCKMDVANITHFMRRITSFTVETVPDGGGEERLPLFDMCYLRIEGTAFLWHQVRCMAAVLFMVGNRLEEPSIVADLLNIEKFPQKPQYRMASDQPLVLAECHFKHLQFTIDPEAADKLRQTLYEQWSGHAIAGAMAQFGATTVLDQSGGATGKAAGTELESALKNGLQNHIPLERRPKEDPYDVRRQRHDLREAAKAAAKEA